MTKSFIGSEDDNERRATNKNAYEYLFIAMNWLERQKGHDSSQILCLQQLRDLIAQKRRSIKYAQITGFLEISKNY